MSGYGCGCGVGVGWGMGMGVSMYSIYGHRCVDVCGICI